MIDPYFFVEWYKNYGRDFPWRKPFVSPFALMVTEMLLRQTQATSVSKIWIHLNEEYPNALFLAAAEQGKLANKIKILGFGEQRSHALISASQWLLEQHNGQVPSSLIELLLVPHIGQYSARAILCFAYEQDAEIVDTNIMRFFSRYYSIEVKPDIRKNPLIWEIARITLPVGEGIAREHNYGILDFTAEICKAKKPECKICPLNTSCSWYTQLIDYV